MQINRESRSTGWIISVIGTATLLVLWELATGVFEVVPNSVLPPLSAVIGAAIEFQDILIENARPTLTAMAFGFIAAVVLGLATGIALTWSERIRNAILPLIVAGNSIPRIAFAPVLIFYIGGFQANYILAAWIAYFPMAINALEGLGGLDEDMDLLLGSVNATRWQEYKLVRFPRSLPFLFDGMKLSLSLAGIGAIVGEYVASNRGLGVLALFALENYQIDVVLAIDAIMGTIVVALYFVLFNLQARLVHWKDTSFVPTD